MTISFLPVITDKKITALQQFLEFPGFSDPEPYPTKLKIRRICFTIYPHLLHCEKIF